MIKKLNILNFQSHKSSTFDFSPGVNVIVGASDSGKSAIIRALRWLIWNRPVGDSFRSHWGGQTSVEIVVPERNSIEPGTHKDQTTLMRTKNENTNQYFLNGTDNVFKAFGNDVPQPIQEILNLDETNLQRQGDSPFLISNSPGEVSGFFNRIAKLDKIDSSLRHITSQARTLTGQIKSDEVRLQSLKTESERYEYLNKAETRLEILEEDTRSQNQRRSGLQTLREIISGILYLDNVTKLDQEIVDRESIVDDLLDMHTMGTQVQEGITLLEEGITTWKLLNTNIAISSTRQKLLDPINEILDLYDSKKEVKENIEDLKSQVMEVSMLAINTRTEQIQLERKETEFEQHMPEICPLCGK
jgi:exonuclease SbcC